jgi:hypothetical protein
MKQIEKTPAVIALLSASAGEVDVAAGPRHQIDHGCRRLAERGRVLAVILSCAALITGLVFGYEALSKA